ncbi:MAG: hypothetical protein F6K17_31410 [Okeania sp. SIO3C4]|nr:hypothetical protein [Okeania sp. SIO3C4]
MNISGKWGILPAQKYQERENIRNGQDAHSTSTKLLKSQGHLSNAEMTSM